MAGLSKAVADKGVLTVSRISGKVSIVAGNKTENIKVKQKLSYDTQLEVGYEGMLDLIDPENMQRITIKSPGRGTIRSLAANEGNSVTTLTRKYLSYIQNQFSTNSKVVSAQRYTDFATVTRESRSVQPAKPKTARDDFESFRQSALAEFEDFRRKATKEYNEFVRQAWGKCEMDDPIPMPQEKKVDPVVYNEGEQTDKVMFRWRKKKLEKASKIEKKEQPQPLAEVVETPPTVEEKKYEPMPFVYCGTEMSVRLNESLRFYMGELSPQKVGDVLDMLSGGKYDNALYDCLSLRKKYNLCDWAYLCMLRSMCDQYCGEGSNESALLTVYLLGQSGYRFRYAMAEGRLYLLVGSDCIVYNRDNFKIDDIYYIPLMDELPKDIYLCPASMPREQCISPIIDRHPLLQYSPTEEKAWVAKTNLADTITVSVNRNLIDFYNSYPKFEPNIEVPSRWACYASIPLDEKVREQLYPRLKALIQGKSKKEAVGYFLNWIQYAFPYELDAKVWGGDRTFFPEETLHYEYCDCEDRAILLTRIVRDLLGLKCALVYYPGHLATAIRFEEEVRGDSFEYDGETYTVCDPTYFGADVGHQMPNMDVDAARLMLLE